MSFVVCSDCRHSSIDITSTGVYGLVERLHTEGDLPLYRSFPFHKRQFKSLVHVEVVLV